MLLQKLKCDISVDTLHVPYNTCCDYGMLCVRHVTVI